jgi:hypothetical protein
VILQIKGTMEQSQIPKLVLQYVLHRKRYELLTRDPLAPAELIVNEKKQAQISFEALKKYDPAAQEDSIFREREVIVCKASSDGRGIDEIIGEELKRVIFPLNIKYLSPKYRPDTYASHVRQEVKKGGIDMIIVPNEQARRLLLSPRKAVIPHEYINNTFLVIDFRRRKAFENSKYGNSEQGRYKALGICKFPSAQTLCETVENYIIRESLKL